MGVLKRTSRLLTQYQYPFENPPFYLTADKLQYDKWRYRHQYSSRQVREGYSTGRTWIGRRPVQKYSDFFKDKGREHTAIFLATIFGILWFQKGLQNHKLNEDKKFAHQIFQDKEFSDRYSYKQKQVEISYPYGPKNF